jgi:NADPH:quinone reductase-like Zn-dependent oxidoreductase
MLAVQIRRIGTPHEALTVTELPLPEPQAGEVRIRVQARPINPSDIMFIRGMYGIRPHPPSGVGFEAMGTVESLGEGVEGISVGQRVSFTALGTWQEYVCVHAKTLIPLPDSIDNDTAAQLYINPCTAWAMLHDLEHSDGLRSGDWLLQTAGASAFGRMIIRLATLRGIKTISTVRRSEQKEHLYAAGADAVVDVSSENLIRRVLALTGEKGVRHAIDAVAGKAGAEVLKVLSYGGVMYCYGALSLEEIPVNAGLVIFKALTIKGFWLTDWMKRVDSTTRKQVLTSLIDLFSTGALTAPVEARYPLGDIHNAVDHAERTGRTGKVLLVG